LLQRRPAQRHHLAHPAAKPVDERLTPELLVLEKADELALLGEPTQRVTAQGQE